MSHFSSRIIAATAVVAGLLTLATPGFASTIQFGSYGGSVAPTNLSNTAITYDNTASSAPTTSFKTGTASAYNPGYTNTIAGTSWVSYDPKTAQASDKGGQTLYTTTYTGALAGATGFISLLADDTVYAYLNGSYLGTTAPGTYDTLATLSIANTVYKNGLNTFQFFVVNGPTQCNSINPTGFDFKATAVTAATPEPSSLIMLGTGLVTAAGAFRRRFRK